MGDVIRRATTEELLAHAGWLHGLACQLAGDGSLAEDAVQETWLTALRGRRPRAGSERPWLARVLRNSLLQGWRKDRSRTDREQAHGREQPSVAPGPDNVVARARGQESLVQAVLDLEEPFRSTVLRRYFDGISSVEMARELGVAPSTVRTRLQRALEILKGRLDLDNRPGLLALAGLPLVPDATGTPAVASITTAPTTWPITGPPLAGTPALAGTTALAATTLTMNAGTKALIGAAALLGLVAVGTKTLTQPAARTVEPDLSLSRSSLELPDAPTALQDDDGGREEVRAVIEESPESPAASAPAEPDIPTTPLPPGELHVLVLVNGVPAQEGRVHVYHGNINGLSTKFREDSDSSRRAAIGADGWARFSGLPSRTMYVGAEVEAGFTQHRRILLLAKEGQRLVIRLGKGRIRGRVFDEYGAPVVGARVTVVGGPDDNRGIGWTDVQGRYEVRGVLAGEFQATALHHGGWQRLGSGETHRVLLQEDELKTVDFGRERALPRLSGAIRNAAGGIVPTVGWAKSHGVLIFENVRTGTVHRILTGDDGTFDVGLPPGNYEVSIDLPSADKTRAVEARLEMPDRNITWDLQIPGAILRGTLHRLGSPIDGDDHSQTVSLYAAGGNGGPTYSDLIDGEGAFVHSGVAPGTYRVLTFPHEVPSGIEVTILEGDTERVLDLYVE